MNIFVTHPFPAESAICLPDKHVVKMILETAQMLYSVHWYKELELPLDAYKKAHINHPCSIWARTSVDNYIWLCKLGLELSKEYTFRYEKIHKTQKHIEWLFKNIPELPKIGFTLPAQAMPQEYKVPENSIEAYRQFYIKNKILERGINKFTKRSIPKWILDEI